MTVDLHAQVLPQQSTRMEDAGAAFRRQQLRPLRSQSERRGGLPGDAVRRMVVVAWHLHGQLALRCECGEETRKQRLVVGNPMESGVGKDEIETGGLKCSDVTQLETEGIGGQRFCLRQHLCGAIDSRSLDGLEPFVKLARQRAGSAPKVGHPHPRPRFDQSKQIVERLRALSLESLVLLGTPHLAYSTIPALRISAISWTICTESLPNGSGTLKRISIEK
jgi:hypothetical protein